MYKKEYGDTGENLAKDFLVNEGHRILLTNYRCHYGEVDIISKDDQCTVFTEVKRRKSEKMGRPHESVTKVKQMKIIRVAYHYAARYNLMEKPMRFDIIEIMGNEVTHIKQAFNVPGNSSYL